MCQLLQRGLQPDRLTLKDKVFLTWNFIHLTCHITVISVSTMNTKYIPPHGYTMLPAFKVNNSLVKMGNISGMALNLNIITI